ncbi:MAG: acyl-CoA dehydrogenase, partial [Planctomycetota bacterium]
EPIVKRELVRRRISRLGGFIVACDALTEWCGWLLDEGFRGEMECIVAKIFGSEAQKEAAIELFMKTHGGRAFLHGHLFGDYVHEFLAPCIYEGEGEMLGMAFFKSLIKEHGRRFFEPIGKALMAAGIRKPNPLNPAHAWALRKAVTPYLLWKLKDFFRFPTPPALPPMPRNLREHALFAATQLQRSHRELDALMTRYQLSLADRQLAMSELSQRIQSMVVMLVTALHAARQDNELVAEAATVLCDEIQRHLTGRRPTTAEFKRLSQTGAAIAEGGFPPLEGVMAPDILMKYDQ